MNGVPWALSWSVSLVPSIVVDAPSALPPTLIAPAEACVTAMVWFPIESEASEARVENPSA